MIKKPARRPKLTGMVRDRGNSRSLVVRFDGRQYSKAVTTRTKKEAQAMLPAFVAEVTSGAYDAKKAAARALSAAPTFKEATAYFLANYLPQDPDGDATRHAYAYALGLVSNELADKRVGDITRAELHRVLMELSRTGRGRARADGSKSLAFASIRAIHAVVSKFFRYMVDEGTITASPMPTFRRLPIGRGEDAAERVRRAALSHGQITALLSACCADHALRLWVMVMAVEALRPGEALALRWGDIGQGKVTVAHSVKRVVGKPGEGRLGRTKTKGSAASIELDAGLGSALAAERDRQETLLRALAGVPANVAPIAPMLGADDCVFPADADNRRVPVSLDLMRDRFKSAAGRAGLHGVTPHFLRHTAITAWLAGTATEPGISVADAASLARHSNSGTTLRTYAHAVQSNMARGISLTGRLIVPTPGAAVEQLTNEGTAKVVSSDR